MKGFEFDPLSLYGLKPKDDIPVAMVQSTYNRNLFYTKAEVDAKVVPYALSTPRITTITSSAMPTINTDDCDAVNITALATVITSMTTNLSGTPGDFEKLTIRIKDDGTARAITWGASFASRGGTLPTTTVISKVTTVGLIYNTVTSTWDCVAVAQEA